MKKQTKKPSKAALLPEAIAPKEVIANCDHQIAERIMPIRGVQVMLDCDLAKLYGVEVKQLNRQVKRNSERFPSDFMFQLSEEESKILKCQFGTSSWGGARYRPYAFTENGIAMLSGVLRSPTAISANIRIMRAFVAMRHALMSSAGVLQRLGTVEVKLIETDKRLDTVFDALDRVRLLPSGIIPAGTEFDSIRQVSRLVESAKSEIVIIDPYADATILDVLSVKGAGVTVRLVCRNRGKPTVSEIAKFNRQYKGLTVSYSDDFHDRFVIIDNAELHNFGSSVNSLVRRVSTYSTRSAKEIKKLLALLP